MAGSAGPASALGVEVRTAALSSGRHATDNGFLSHLHIIDNLPIPSHPCFVLEGKGRSAADAISRFGALLCPGTQEAQQTVPRFLIGVCTLDGTIGVGERVQGFASAPGIKKFFRNSG